MNGFEYELIFEYLFYVLPQNMYVLHFAFNSIIYCQHTEIERNTIPNNQ